MNAAAAVAALAVLGMLTCLGLYGTYFILGARYDADEDADPYPHRDDEDTAPWPAPR